MRRPPFKFSPITQLPLSLGFLFCKIRVNHTPQSCFEVLGHIESPWRSVNTVFLLLWLQTKSPPTKAVVHWSMFNNGLPWVGGRDKAHSWGVLPLSWPFQATQVMVVTMGLGSINSSVTWGSQLPGPLTHSGIFQGWCHSMSCHKLFCAVIVSLWLRHLESKQILWPL